MGSDVVRRAPDDIIRNNPRVDEAKLREAERTLQALRERGVRPPPPTVVSPYGQKLVRKSFRGETQKVT